MAKSYRRLNGRDVWHFRPDCQWWLWMTYNKPLDAYVVKNSKPRSGELCNECLAKQRREDAVKKVRARATKKTATID